MRPSTSFQNALSLGARVLIALLLVPSGWGKIGGFAGTVGYIASKGVPLPEVCAAIGIIAELGVGLMLLFGFKTRWAALALLVYLLVITPIFHAFWGAPPAQHMVQFLHFYKNLAIAGGLMSIVAYGGGAWSLDGRRESAASQQSGLNAARA